MPVVCDKDLAFEAGGEPHEEEPLSAENYETWTAIGTVGAVFVALAIALTQAGVAIVLSVLRRRQAHRKVASLVSAWVEHECAPSSFGEYYQRTVSLHLANESDEPVFRVELLCGIQTEKGPIQLGPLSAPPVTPVLPAKREFTYDVTMGLLGFGDFAHDSFRGLVARVAFRDHKDRPWQREFDGKPEKVRKPKPAIITEASDDLAFAQAGPLDNPYNPRAAVFAFADVAANEDVSDLEFGELLSTQAPGWAKSPLALIKEFRTMICNVNHRVVVEVKARNRPADFGSSGSSSQDKALKSSPNSTTPHSSKWATQ